MIENRNPKLLSEFHLELFESVGVGESPAAIAAAR